MKTLQTLRSRLSRLNTRYLLLPLFGLLSAPAFAGSDTTFQSMVDWIQDKLTGSMGMLLALVALVIAIISASMGKFTAFMAVLVVVAAATLGTAIIIGMFTATI
ncbi:TrbC/VirB2 family protein [Neisseria sp. 23W00296]|uniref:TrbC/VirB2 family protein n=1 Tax=unclassified Neisseria TaxID=2623750 RepID=UPI00375741D2